MDKKNLGYYESNIKTSRDNDSVYAMKYASQQILIDKLQQENQKLKNQQKEFIQWLESEISFIKNTYSQINGDYMMMNPVIENWIAIMEKILSKYKEIIGGKE